MWTKTAVNIGKNKGGADGWHYAQLWKTGGGPIGFCAEHDPHPTEAEARECYAAYLRAQLREVQYGDWTGCRMDGCDTPTKAGYGCDGYHDEPLCDEHRTVENAVVVLALDKPAGDSMGS